MRTTNVDDLKGLYRPPKDSHKGQNGRLLVIGGSKLFHSSIFWAADVASKIVDLVHFSSPATENNDLVRMKLKEGFWNGIVVPWERIEEYIREDDCIVIGPGMVRREYISEDSENSENQMIGEPDDQRTRAFKNQTSRISESPNRRRSESSEFSEALSRAGEIDDTRTIVNLLLQKYPAKRWVIDGGALQEVDLEVIPSNAILTPHRAEFGILKDKFLISNFPSTSRYGTGEFLNNDQNSNIQIDKLVIEDQVKILAKTLKCTILLKGVKDIVCAGRECDPQICTPGECVVVEGGNEGMTKGGTGDVLAGLVGALYCKNEAMLAAMAGSFINKRAGDNLYKRVRPYFNASDLVEEVAKAMKEVMG